MNNKRNLYYFNAPTMKALHKELDDWQEENQKRFLQLNVQKEGSEFSCLALTNPTEVVITDKYGTAVDIYKEGYNYCLMVKVV